MNLYKKTLEQIQVNRKRVLDGSVNCIPTDLKRFSKVWPGVERGTYYLTTASSGVGKSKLTKKLFVFDLVDAIMQHPEWGIDLHIKYFCLEESKVNFMQSLMAYKLYNSDRKRVSIAQLNSLAGPIDEQVTTRIHSFEKYWQRFEQMVDVIDDVRHATGIFKTVEDWLLAHGHWVMHDKEFTNNETGQRYVRKVRDYYVPNHPNRYVIVVVDHVSLLTPEKSAPTLRDAIGKLSSSYFLQLRDKYNATCVLVQQQAAEVEKQQFTYKGQSIEAKLEPSLSGLADNKTTQRDCDIAFGLFAPDRYEIEKYMGYDITKLQDHFRSIKILKYRNGIANVRLPLFFDGATGHFEELPKVKDMTQEDYEILRGRVGLLNK